MSKTILIITGPTATGKTALGIALAKAGKREIISADSMQVYKLMDIGTAKPSKQEIDGIPHYMIDIVEPWEDYSVARYVSGATDCIDEITGRGNLPIIVGGTGFYIDSLISKRSFPAKADSALRKELEDKYDKTGGAAMLCELGKFDEITAARLHENDKKRIVRAFEVYKTTGKPLSEYNQLRDTRYNCIKIALNYSDRDVLYEKINKRADDMIAKGLVKEVENLLKEGISRECTSMQAIGYKEIIDYLDNKTTLTDAISRIKQESARYAKRQLTWLRRDKQINWILWDTEPDILEAMQKVERLLIEAK